MNLQMLLNELLRQFASHGVFPPRCEAGRLSLQLRLRNDRRQLPRLREIHAAHSLTHTLIR